MVSFIFWVLIPLILLFGMLEKPQRPITKGSTITYFVKFSRLRDREMLDFLSRFNLPDRYVLNLVRSDISGGPRPCHPEVDFSNDINKTRVLSFDVNIMTDGGLIDSLNRKSFFLSHYVKNLIRCDMNREGAAEFMSSLNSNA